MIDLKTEETLTNRNNSVRAYESGRPQQAPSNFSIAPKQVAVVLLLATALLLGLHLIVVYIKFSGNYGPVMVEKLDRFFNVNNEYNLPTFFSCLLLLMASAILYFIYKICTPADSNRKKWLLLSFIFLFLAADEMIELHERVNAVTRQFVTNDMSGYLFWAWIIPYTILFLAVGFYLMRFVLQLPKRTRNYFILSAIVFFSGAVMIESVEGRLNNSYDVEHPVFVFTTTLQEVMEMVGVIIFIYAILDYLVTQFREVHLVRD